MNKNKPTPVDLLEVMEQMAAFVATVTGVKQQLLDAGWSAENAEQIVVHALKQAQA